MHGFPEPEAKGSKVARPIQRAVVGRWGRSLGSIPRLWGRGRVGGPSVAMTRFPGSGRPLKFRPMNWYQPHHECKAEIAGAGFRLDVWALPGNGHNSPQRDHADL